MAFSRVMLWQMSHAWYGELLRTWMVEKVGARHAAELEIEYPRLNPVTLPDGIEFNVRSAKGALARAPRGPFLHRAMGSNAWAVAGGRTTTGKPFLCNDMHLALRPAGAVVRDPAHGRRSQGGRRVAARLADGAGWPQRIASPGA